MKGQPFEEVVEEHGAVVLKVVRALLGPHEAADAWSETFLAALEAYPRLRPDSDVRAWLITIAHRKAIDHLRVTTRVPVPSDHLPERAAPDGPAEAGDPELWRAVGALPFKQRAAVAYHHLAGLPYVQVGPLIDSTEGAARRSAADGIAALRKTYSRGART
ncbi:MAG: sigma-70 family RNA polymerase sigma factor [Actinomycetota bacterium]|nr:sigma-70 family RNA polymerase sigma factor [Actinomycetota bacterium]